MWSEHCGYKHSRRLLKTLPTEGPRLRDGAGRERGRGVAWATGWRARSRSSRTTTRARSSPSRAPRPASAASCATSSPSARGRSRSWTRCASARSSTSARSRYLLERAVAGIGHYGNSIGIATVGGEIYFEGPYEQNCLVNAMCARPDRDRQADPQRRRGRREHRRAVRRARPGRDGIGGASVLASRRARRLRGQAPDRADRRPVQEKKLLECSLELLDRGLLVALQDLGAAGLTSSSAEMAAKGEVGLDLDVRRVPLREADMEPFEIMVSRVAGADALRRRAVEARRGARGLRALGGQRRPRSARSRTRAACASSTARRWSATCPSPRWSTSARPTTSSPPSPPRRCTRRRRRCCRPTDPAEMLLGAARRPPTSRRARGRSSSTTRSSARAPSAAPRRPTPRCCCSRAPVGNGVRGALPAVDATGRGPRSPSRSTATAAASPPIPTAARSRPSSSARPTSPASAPSRSGLTNCLNFGNPEKPHIAWQLTRAIAGLGDACRAFGVPVVGGNVSLYNEGAEGPIYPTPVVGLVGELPDARRAGRLGFAHAGRRDRADHRRSGRRRWPPRSSPSCAASRSPARCRPPISASSRRCTPRSARPSAPARCTPPTTSPRAASRSRWPSARSPCGLGAVGLGAGVEASCSARARARSSSPARPASLRRVRRRRAGDRRGRRRRAHDRGRAHGRARSTSSRAHDTGSPRSCTDRTSGSRRLGGMRRGRPSLRGDAHAPDPRTSTGRSSDRGGTPARRRPRRLSSTSRTRLGVAGASHAAEVPLLAELRARVLAEHRPTPARLDRRRPLRARAIAAELVAAGLPRRQRRFQRCFIGRRPRRGRGPRRASRTTRPSPSSCTPSAPAGDPLPPVQLLPPCGRTGDPRRPARDAAAAPRLERRVAEACGTPSRHMQVVGHRLEDLDVRVDRRVVVGDRERPLLLAPGRHEDAAVHVVEPGQLGEVLVLVGLEGLVVDDLRRRERDAALGADADGVARAGCACG